MRKQIDDIIDILAKDPEIIKLKLRKTEIENIARVQFEFLAQELNSNSINPVKLQYLGKFKPKKSKVEKLKAKLENKHYAG